MRRRDVLSAVALGTVPVAGCVGGNEVVTSVQRTVSVTPGQGWVTEVPDTSGGAIQYKARANQPFDVFFFTTDEQYLYYRTYTGGDEPARTPAGDRAVGDAAEQVSDTSYQAQTPDGGARESIDADGRCFFVVDHSDYRDGPSPDAEDEPLSVFLDMTVTERRFP